MFDLDNGFHILDQLLKINQASFMSWCKSQCQFQPFSLIIVKKVLKTQQEDAKAAPKKK
jgi:hypothetical protein